MNVPRIVFAVTVLGICAVAQSDGFVVHRVALSPDASTAAYGRVTELGGGGVLLVRKVGATGSQRLGRASIVRGITFAPDGSSIFTTDDRGAVHQVSVAGAALRTFELGRVAGFCTDVAVSRDGTRMAAVDQEKRLQIFDVATGDRLWAKSFESLPLCAMFLPNGDVAVGNNVGVVTMWSAGGERRSRNWRIDANVMQLAVDDAGEQLAVGGWNGAISVFDLRTHGRRDLPNSGKRLYSLSWSQDGRYLAAAGQDEVVVADLQGADRLRRLPQERAIGALRWRVAASRLHTRLLGADYRGGITELMQVERRPYPQDVTAATRDDKEELARLLQPGDVLFRDGFESEETFGRYFEIQGRDDGRVTIAHEPARVHSGTGSLRLTATDNDGKSRGAGPVLWLGNEGHDCVHLRYWIRYADDYDQGNLHHTGGSLSGVAGSNKWGGMGGAGLRPKGDDNYSTRVEGWRDWGRRAPPGYLHCYTYWMDMKQGRDGNYWGNMLAPVPTQRVVPKRATWQCVELRVQNNQLGQADGELVVWLDGRLYVHYRGFRWRSAEDVRIKRVGLLCYVHEARQDNTVWFDDVVVSTGYVGPGGQR